MSVAVGLAVGIALLVAEPAASAPSASAAVPEVEGIVAGPAREVQVLKSAIGDSLARQGLALVLNVVDTIAADQVTTVPRGGERAVARFRLDLASLPRAKLYLLDGERRRVYVRWLSLPRGLDPVAVELIRFVVESSVEAIRAGLDIGVSREEYDRSLRPPVEVAPVVPVVPAPLELGVAARYEGTLLARGTFQHGPGFSLSARSPNLRIAVDILMRLPVTIGGDAVDARIQGGALRVAAAAPVLLSGPLSLWAGAAGGIDVSQVRPSTKRADLDASPSFWATSPFLRLFAAVQRDWRRLSVAAIIGVDVDLLGERYLVANGAGTQEAFSPARARPFAAVLFGAHR